MVLNERWWIDAACRCEPTEMFFPEPDGDAEAAKAVCRRCPALAECLDEAMTWAYKLDYGVWGATTPRERAFLRGLTRQARPKGP